MPYLLPCECGTKIVVGRSQAGSSIECPHCQKSLEIPTIRGLSGLELADANNLTSSPKKRNAPHWSPLRGIVAAGCFLTAFIGLGFAAQCGLSRLAHPTPFTIDDALVAGDLATEELSPAETWDTWKYFQQTGLGKKEPPQAFVLQRLLERQDTWMIRSAILGGLGLLGLVFTTLWPTRRIP